MITTARWISAGSLSLFLGTAHAADPAPLAPVPADPPASIALTPCDPCAPACDPCCPTKPPKCKTVKSAPPRIIVHQSQPIVEFRNDAPAAAPCQPRKVINDCAVRPVGGEGHNGCGCDGSGSGWFNFSKTRNYYGGHGHGKHYAQPTMAMAAMPITVQAYVPTPVQSFAYVPQAPAFAPYGLAGYNAPAVDANAVRALAEVIAAANSPLPPKSAAQAAPAANGLAALEARVQNIDERLRRVERKLEALCKE